MSRYIHIMTILITTANKGFFLNHSPKLTFTDSTLHTCTFKITYAKFELLRTYIREQGLNPFALMSW